MHTYFIASENQNLWPFWMEDAWNEAVAPWFVFMDAAPCSQAPDFNDVLTYRCKSIAVGSPTYRLYLTMTLRLEERIRNIYKESNAIASLSSETQTDM